MLEKLEKTWEVAIPPKPTQTPYFEKVSKPCEDI